MVKLLQGEVRSREVLDWKGLHLFHADLSSCSQKLRIFLREKGLYWHSHAINIAANENISEFYLGVNPRGLVPALVDDGDVHIESNDIMLYLEAKHPTPRLVPADGDSIEELLRHEDNLHVDIRNVTFRFLFEPPVSPKPPEVLDRYRQHGAATVGGEVDKQKLKEIAFWEGYGDQRVTDAAARESVSAFRRAFSDLDAQVRDARFLLGSSLSVVDIAWFIYANRMVIAGYPLAALHPYLHVWYERMAQRPGWVEEVAMPAPLQGLAQQHQQRLAQEGRRMVDICDLTPDNVP